MFDNIGRDPDQEANKRRAASFMLTILFLAAGGGFATGIAAWTATTILPELLDDSEMVEVVMADAEFEDEAPPPPPPPPPPPAAADEAEEEEEEEEEEDDEEEPDPDEMNEEVEELEEEPEEQVKSASKPQGVVGGVEGGVEGGEVGGVIGGVVGGVIGGQLGGQLGVRVVHHSELEVRRRVNWEYPKAAAELNLGDQRCLAKVYIGEDGVPYDVEVDACPRVFHETTRQALLKWRWYPPKDGRERFKAQTTIGVNYKYR